MLSGCCPYVVYGVWGQRSPIYYESSIVTVICGGVGGGGDSRGKRISHWSSGELVERKMGVRGSPMGCSEVVVQILIDDGRSVRRGGLGFPSHHDW